MLQESSIDKIGVFTGKYTASLNFYKNILKLETVWEDPKSKNAGFRIGFNLLIIQEDQRQVKPGGIRIYFTAKNIETIREELLKNNIPCSQIIDIGDFRLLDFTDPDHNRLGLMEPADDYIPTLEKYLDRKLMGL